jgi:hypothetical protein
MKFKEGDRVKILNSANFKKYEGTYGIGWNPSMKKYVGTTDIIRYISGWHPSLGEHARLEISGYLWFTSDLRLENEQERLNRKYGYEV